MLHQSLLIALLVLIILALSALVAAAFVSSRRRARGSRDGGWLTDQMVQEILRSGQLSERHVPEEGLDLDEIAREEERFWSETWDEPEAHWE